MENTLKKSLILVLSILLIASIASGCSVNTLPSLSEEGVSPIVAQEATKEPLIEKAQEELEPIENAVDTTPSLKEAMLKIDFEEVAGYYTRTAIEDESEYVEMFVFEKNTFARIATNDLEREVFAYNYLADDFTYIYYFDGEMTAKTEMNIGTGIVYLDESGYAELLTLSAEELKTYFSDLMEAAGISPVDLH